MIGYLKEQFYWPECAEDAREWCKTCGMCATRKSQVPNSRAPLQGIQTGYPMQIVAVDIMGPLPVISSGNSTGSKRLFHLLGRKKHMVFLTKKL